MADKQATVYIVDVGRTMADHHEGRAESDLDWSLRFVWDKLCTAAESNRKTLLIGILALRSDETKNVHAADGLQGYENISVLRQLEAMTLADMRELQSKMRPSNTSHGDAVSAIVTACNIIDRKAPGRLKYTRKIVLVTDGKGFVDGDSFPEIAARINELKIKLTILGVDFDDAEYGFKEEDKPDEKASNEKLLKALVDDCNKSAEEGCRADFGTMAEAIDGLATREIKLVRPWKSYGGPLTLGDPDKYEGALSIEIERYSKTKRALLPSASSTVQAEGVRPSASQSTATLNSEGGGGAAENEGVGHSRTYKIEDPEAPGGKRDVDFNGLAKGYQYGSTVVYISESDWNVTKLETSRSLSILGFIPFNRYDRFMNMSEASIIVPQKFNEESEVAFSSLVHALYELESYAVARFVEKDGKDPVLLLLIPDPKAEAEYDCLYDIRLPFAEDVRPYQFAPLDKVYTVSGGVLTEHRLLPDNKLEKAMSDYVDAMDLETFGRDDNGNPADYFQFEDSYNPLIHRIKQAVRARVLFPGQAIAPPAQDLLKYTQPPEELAKKTKTQIQALIDTAEVKQVPKKAKGKRRRGEEAGPLPTLDMSELFSGTQPKMSEYTAVADFKRALRGLTGTGDVSERIQEVASEMGSLVRNLITNSVAFAKYAQAEENIRVMREELISDDEPEIYNSFLRALKKSLLSGELGGDRRDMWRTHIVAHDLGLITRTESELSEVTEEEAEAFLRSAT